MNEWFLQKKMEASLNKWFTDVHNLFSHKYNKTFIYESISVQFASDVHISP